MAFADFEASYTVERGQSAACWEMQLEEQKKTNLFKITIGQINGLNATPQTVYSLRIKKNK